MPQDSIQIKVSGRKLAPTLPALLRPAARSAAQGVDEFLPPGYLTPTTTFDVGASARSASDSVVDSRHDAREDEIVVLELADGSTFITSAERLRASLAQTRPDLLGPNGEILLEKLRAESSAARGIFSEAVGGLVAKVFTFLRRWPDQRHHRGYERRGRRCRPTGRQLARHQGADAGD